MENIYRVNYNCGIFDIKKIEFQDYFLSFSKLNKKCCKEIIRCKAR